jgi:hypothetical protein
MTLPAGSVCGGCVFVEHCVRMYGVTKDRTMCDFFPRRFKAAAPVEVPDG